MPRVTSSHAGRLFASNYQMMICESLDRVIAENENWDDEKISQGFAGGISCRLEGTEADLNDHWVELLSSGQPPELSEWQRVTCVSFRSETGQLLLMSVIDDAALLEMAIGKGDFSIYVAGQNFGVDQLSLGEEKEISDSELSLRKDLEWYSVYVVPGLPEREGRIRDA